jgi:hypothetical protein
MDYWRRSAELRGRAWDYLESQVRPDIALVQEAVPLGRGRAESDTADVVVLACCRRETPIVREEFAYGSRTGG